MIFFGIITGIILASLANDEIILLQANTPAERENAQFYIGIFTLSAVSSTATMVSIRFLTILPKIISWIKV